MAAQGWCKRRITNLIEKDNMEKYIMDGKVAVLYSSGFGAGWSTWNSGRDWNGQDLGQVLLYAPAIVEMVLTDTKQEDIRYYCEKLYGAIGYFGGAADLRVEWMKPGTQFMVREYDGSESIQYKEDTNWLVA
jgi:hypothetical protein